MRIAEYRKIEEVENEHFWYRAMEESTMDMLAGLVSKGAKVLDAGCGTGGFSTKMAGIYDVTAVDINETAIEHAKRKGITKVVKCSVESLPFKDAIFDAVVCLDVLYHRMVRDDERAIAEFYRVLAPGGILFIRLPAFEILRGSHDKIVQTRHRYRRDEVGRKLKRAGFINMKLSYANMLLALPLLVKRLKERVTVKENFTSDSIMLPRPVNSLFYMILKAENKILNIYDLPFGSSVVAIARKSR